MEQAQSKSYTEYSIDTEDREVNDDNEFSVTESESQKKSTENTVKKDVYYQDKIGRKKVNFFETKIRKPKTTLNGEYVDEYSNAEIGTGCERYYRGERVKYTSSRVENFCHIVDLDDFEYHKITFHSFLSEVLLSAYFRFGILFLVLLNAVLIGLATNDDILNNYAAYFNAADQIILSIFIFEILIKWMYDFRLFFKVTWNILDFLIVTMIVISSIIPDIGNNKSLVVVRVFRAFRSLRSVSSLTSLTIVTHTVLKSAVDMVNILIVSGNGKLTTEITNIIDQVVNDMPMSYEEYQRQIEMESSLAICHEVLLIIMTVQSIMGVILFDSIGTKKTYFLNALEAWYLLFVCVTQDGWQDYLEFLEKADYFPLTTVYIMIGVSIGGFVFSNLIIAVVVANLELSVTELKLEKQQEENPLENKEQFSVDELDVLPVYELFVQNNIPLRVQRPMKLPTFKKISERRLTAFIMIIVALEQNMLEASLLHSDLEKVMNVEINIVKQMQKLTPERVEKERELGTKVLNDFNRLGSLGNHELYLQRMNLFQELNKLNVVSQQSQSYNFN